MFKPSVISSKGVCSSGEHMGVCLGTAARGACAPHEEPAKEQRVGGRDSRQESRAADALMRIRLCCCILEEGPRGGKDRMRGDKPEQADVLFQGAVKDWKDHLTL